MALTDTKIRRAKRAAKAQMAAGPRAKSARYDRRLGRVIVRLDNEIDLTFPPRLAEGLEAATPSDLGTIEISPSGLGLHWPRLDADLYLPALIEGVFGSRRWMAAMMGRTGGRARTEAKAVAARANGQRGGRPRKVVQG